MSDISVHEYKKRKAALEQTLASQIGVLTSKFEQETGVNIHDVYVNFSEVTPIGEKEKFILTSVNIKTEISN